MVRWIMPSANSTAAPFPIPARKKREHLLFSAFSGGIRFTRVFSNAMSFRAGLNYSQVNEKFQVCAG